MAIITSETTNVTVKTEAYAPSIRILGNPEDVMAGSVLLDFVTLEYHDGVLRHTTPLESAGETIADFVGRTFDVQGRTITGLDLMLVVKQYAVDIKAERGGPIAGLAPAGVTFGGPESVSGPSLQAQRALRLTPDGKLRTSVGGAPVTMWDSARTDVTGLLEYSVAGSDWAPLGAADVLPVGDPLLTRNVELRLRRRGGDGEPLRTVTVNYTA